MEPSAESVTRTASVLIVDDSIVQRQHAAALCTQLGVQRILEAADGAAALMLLREVSDPPQVAVIDLEMPNMDGVELIQRLVELRHPPAVIVASSRPGLMVSAVETMVTSLGLSVLGAFRKPLTFDGLSEALARYRSDNAPQPGWTDELPWAGANELASAISQGEIVPHYQPKIRLSDGQLMGVEMLARWLPPGKHPIPPTQFIPLAETHALIHDLTLALAEQALRDLSAWHAGGWPLSIAINLSPLLLSSPHFLGEATALVNNHHVEPDKVIWEITESLLVGDNPGALGLLVRLRLKGFGLSIDDYGTGFSSMQQLSRIPFTELKIDRSFVHGAAQKPHLQAILQSAIELSQKLGLTSVAEGIELESDLDLLQRLGSDIGQGYLLGRPMSAEAFTAWLARQTAGLALRQA